MRGDFWKTWLPWILLATAAVALGVGIAIASSPRSLARSIPRAAGAASAAAVTTPRTSPRASPSPVPQLKPGQLTAPVKLQLVGDRLFLVGAGRAISSSDGSNWTPLPTGVAGGLVIPDPSNANRFVSGGTAVRVSPDGGATWRITAAAPPAGGPYQPLVISPSEPNVWFILHQGQLGRTRDAGISWRNLPGLPALGANPVLVAGSVKGQFFIAAQAQVFELEDNGQQIQGLGQLPAGQMVSELLQATPGTPGLLLARTSAGSVFALRDGTWSDAHPSLTGPIGGAPGKLALVVDGGGEVGTRGRILVSSDGGQTWTPASGLPDQSVLTADATADGQTAYAYCAAGDIYRSQDGGRTWSLLSSTLRTP